MKALLKPRPATIVTMLTTAVLVIATFAQAPRNGQSNAASAPKPPARTYPAPTNLNVLPRNLTGQQVHDIMEHWRGDLGVRCNACHVEDPDNVIPGGPALPRFGDDSKPMKEVARLMYTMTEEINRAFVARVKESRMPVTCGTCHRGRISPEPFAYSPEGELSPTHAPLGPGMRPLP